MNRMSKEDLDRKVTLTMTMKEYQDIYLALWSYRFLAKSGGPIIPRDTVTAEKGIDTFNEAKFQVVYEDELVN